MIRRPIVLLLALCALVAAFAAEGGPALGGPPVFGTMVFRDDDGTMILTIDLDPASAELGIFSVRVTGVGTFVPLGRAKVERDGRSKVEFEYEGAFDLHSASGTASRVRGELEGKIKLDTGKGSAKLETERATYKLKARGLPSAKVQEVLPAFEGHLAKGEWSALYEMLTADMRSSTSAAAFEAALRAQTATLGPIEAVRRLGVGSPAPSRLGLSYVVVSYEVDRRTTAGPRTTTYDAYFIFEEPSWRLWYTAPR